MLSAQVRPSVLIVDDEPLIRWTLSQALSGVGCQVREAGSGTATMHALEENPRPSVILLDYCLPDVQHLGLLSGLLARLPNARVILITAFGDAELPDEALACGAYAVIAKPFNIDAVLALVARASGFRLH